MTTRPPIEHEPAGITTSAGESGGVSSGSVALPVGIRAAASTTRFELVSHVRPLGRAASFELALVVCFVVALAFALGVHRLVGDIALVVAGVLIVPLAYGLLCALFNRTVLLVEDGVLTVKQRPLPWLPVPPLAREEIEQLLVRRVDRNRRSAVDSIEYVVSARTTSGRQHDLVLGLETEEQGLYIEQEVERALWIEDAPVEGEVERIPSSSG